MREPKEFCRILDGLYEYIHRNNYEGFMRAFKLGGSPYNPNILSPQSCHVPIIHGPINNLRITAELLRAGAELDYKLYYSYDPLICHAAVNKGHRTLILLILYIRGMQPFETIRDKEGKTALDRLMEINCPRVTAAEVRALLIIVKAPKQLIMRGDQLRAERQYHEAFEYYNDAAHRLLTFHQGDPNLMPFYQEEARVAFYSATMALVAEMTQPVTVESGKLLSIGEQQILKRLRLIKYIADTVLRSLDQIEGLECFINLIAQWQLPQGTIIDWSKPEFSEFAPRRTRSPSKDSALGSSSESLNKVIH